MKATSVVRCTLGGLLLSFLLGGCVPQGAGWERIGSLPAGARISARSLHGDISAYAPLRGQDPSTYTIAVYGVTTGQSVTTHPRQVEVRTTALGVKIMVRGSRGAHLALEASNGAINVADFDGVVDARTGTGDIRMLIPQYGNASAGAGNVNVIFGSTAWPGTLHFYAGKGDVELYVNEHAAAQVHLFTAHGTIFTDFPLKGTSSGESERIDGTINGGAKRAIDVRVRDGSIRLLQLKPQV